MVKMKERMRWSIWGVDLACGAIVVALTVSALWLLVGYMDGSDNQMINLRKGLSNARLTLATLQVNNASQQNEIQQQKKDLLERGALPTEFPAESYFQDLAWLATKAGVTIQSQVPMVAAEYPGLIEQRSQFEISGSLKAILAFFGAIEQSLYWADIGYFSLAQGGGAEISSRHRTAKFTISMFSARPLDADQAKDGSS